LRNVLQFAIGVAQLDFNLIVLDCGGNRFASVLNSTAPAFEMLDQQRLRFALWEKQDEGIAARNPVERK
jgi:hypothetical protein